MVPVLNYRHVEELVRLPECFLCYTPSLEAGPVCPTPALSNGFVTFGSFNNLAKVSIMSNMLSVSFVYQEQISHVSPDVCTSISSDYTQGIAGLGEDTVCNSEFPPCGKM